MSIELFNRDPQEITEYRESAGFPPQSSELFSDWLPFF